MDSGSGPVPECPTPTPEPPRGQGPAGDRLIGYPHIVSVNRPPIRPATITLGVAFVAIAVIAVADGLWLSAAGSACGLLALVLTIRHRLREPDG